jgi:hypothetical protein
VEVKVPKGMIGSRGITGLMGSDAMAAPSQYFIVTPKTREKDVWDLDPILGDDPDQRGAGDSFTSRSDSARATNNNRLMKQGLNPNSSENQIQQRYGSGSDGGQNESLFGAQSGFARDNSRFGAQSGLERENSRFGARNVLDRENSKVGARNESDRDRNYAKFGGQSGLDKVNARPSDLFGRGFSGADDDSSWTKAFGHDASRMERLNYMRSMPSMSNTKPFTGGAFEERMSNAGLGSDSVQAPPSFPGITSVDDGQSRPTEQQAGAGQVYLRAWAPSASPVSGSRNLSHPDQINNPRVVASSIPAVLPMPERPGNPH